MTLTLVNSDFSSDRLRKTVDDILRTTQLFSMATANIHAECHIHVAYFCFNRDLDLFSVSDISTVHAKNVAAVPRVAVSICDTHQPWDSPHRGLQLFGKCWLASLAESATALRHHAERFHAYGDYIRALNPFERDKSPYKFFVFRPETIKIFDEAEFGEETFVVANVQRS